MFPSPDRPESRRSIPFNRPVGKVPCAKAARPLVALVAAACLLLAPIDAMAKKGAKNFKAGLRHEAAQQWEKAVQEFTLAVAAEPSDAEYQLHYRRALFNASHVQMLKGKALAEAKDYLGAYNAFRQAYAYDPANNFALREMERMLRLHQGGADDAGTGTSTPAANERGAFNTQEAAAYQGDANQNDSSTDPAQGPAEHLKTIAFSDVEVQEVIRYLAKQLRLNVVFDRDFPRLRITLNLQDVTAAQALDYIFVSQNLFFQRLNRRTILVVDQSRRAQYQQLTLRTFYLNNIEANDARTLLQGMLPAQMGRAVVIVPEKGTNSITVRDTPENIRLIGELLGNIDKDRAEVVIDVNIYEVSRSDLLQFGNQLGSDAALTNLGGVQDGFSILGGAGRRVATGVSGVTVPTALGAALVLPASAISALQRRDRTRLLASTQVHAFSGEESTTRIGQRVPVQTAQTFPFGYANTNQQAEGGVNPGVGFAGGFPVFNYEATGLTLKFTPQVFPSRDVQVKMTIESKDVINPGNPTPTFTERTINGTARIQNGQTMMLVSVAQDRQADGRAGLPLLGLVPVLGRLFTAPRRDNAQTDIVMAVTPHVLRAPVITPRDEMARPGGTVQAPTAGSLEAMVREADREEQIAAEAARRRNSAQSAAVPRQREEAQTFVPAPKALLETARVMDEDVQARKGSTATPSMGGSLFASRNATAAPASARPAVTTTDATALPVSRTETAARPAATSAAQLLLTLKSQEMYVGERQRMTLVLKTDAALSSAMVALRFDPRLVTLRASQRAAQGATHTLDQSLDPSGVLRLMVRASGQAATLDNVLLIPIEVEAVSAGDAEVNFLSEAVTLITSDNRRVTTRVSGREIKVRP